MESAPGADSFALFSQSFLILVARCGDAEGDSFAVVISCYVENLCAIPRIKYSGSQQLAKDVG